MSARIRDYQPGDEAATYYVCLKTGDHGQDGEPFFQEDGDALGRIYTGPYLAFQPDLALILEDEQGVCGYALAAYDSRAFYEQYDREWRPRLCRDFPDPQSDPATWSRVEEVYHAYHHPKYTYPEPYDQYPSHLHIDLLPRAQRQGHGRQMIEKLLRRLKSMNSPGVHLEMSTKNDAAYQFYRALGFQELLRDDESIYLGMKLT